MTVSLLIVLWICWLLALWPTWFLSVSCPHLRPILNHFQIWNFARLGKHEEDNSRQRHYSSILLGLFGGKFPVFKFLKFNFPLGRRKNWIKHGKFSQNSSCSVVVCSRLQTSFCQNKKIILTLISDCAGDVWSEEWCAGGGPPVAASGPVKNRGERVGVKSWCNLFKTTRAHTGGGGTLGLPPRGHGVIGLEKLRKSITSSLTQPFSVLVSCVNHNHYRHVFIRKWHHTALLNSFRHGEK